MYYLYHMQSVKQYNNEIAFTLTNQMTRLFSDFNTVVDDLVRRGDGVYRHYIYLSTTQYSGLRTKFINYDELSSLVLEIGISGRDK